MGRKKKADEVVVEEKVNEVVEEFNPMDEVKRLSTIESLTFGKLDAEIRNALQGVQLSNYKKQDARLEYEAKLRREDEQIAALNNSIKRLRVEYEALLDEIIKKYDIRDKTKMTIDPDTGIIQELD